MKPEIGVRLSVSDLALLKKVAAARGETLSDFMRRAIRAELARLGFLSEEEKKALGVSS